MARPTKEARDELVETTTLDVESYLSSYTGVAGNTRINRAIFIGDLCPPLRVDAYSIALHELRTLTTDTKRYVAVATKLAEAQAAEGKPPVTPDLDWVAQVDREVAIRGDKLEQELKIYKSNMIKESIRMGHNDLGDFYYKRGDLSNALKCYQRTRDYCTTSKHIFQMCQNVIRVAIELEQFTHVMTFSSKALTTPDITKDNMMVSRLMAAVGLNYLHQGEYRLAADNFAKVSFESSNSFNEIISAQDIGLYGGLCALACYDRKDLKNLLLNNANFRQFIELVPRVRVLLDNFVKSRYTDVLTYLEQSKPDAMLDLYLRGHVNSLYEEIQKRSLVQYVAPYQTVDLHQMAAAFNMPLPKLESTLIQLVLAESINARIDSQRKVLVARQSDARLTTLDRSLKTGSEFARQSKAALLRMNMLKADFVVRRSDGGHGGASMGESAMAVDGERASTPV